MNLLFFCFKFSKLVNIMSSGSVVTKVNELSVAV